MKRSTARATGMLAVSILIAVFAVAPVAFAADKVWVCKVVGGSGNRHLQTGEANPISVAVGSEAFTDIFRDNQASFVLQPGDYSGAEPTFGDCDAKWDPRPAISVVKTAVLSGSDTLADAGETITYSFQVTNTGNVALSGVAVADDMVEVGAVTCLADTLVPTASTTCSAASVHKVTQADIDQGDPIVNTATASGEPPTGSPATATATVSTPTQQPEVAPDTLAISVVKTATLNDVAGNTAGKADAGETIMYSFLVTNTGSVTLSGVAVTDSKLASPIVCDPTELAPTAHVTCTTAAYLVTASDVVAGLPIVNMATAWGTKPGGGTVTDTDTVSTPTQQPALDQVGPVDPVDPVVPTISPRITLKAEVVNDAGGTAEVSDFTLTGSSIEVTREEAVQESAAMVASAVTTSFSGVTGAAAITNVVVPVGTYFLSESALPSGYSASAWACTGGQLNGSAITVALGNTVECVITNTYSSVAADPPGVSPVDSTDVPSADPASPSPAVLGVGMSAPGAKAPSAAIPAATTLAFTGAETVPLSLLALLALVLGVALTVAGRRQGGQRARE